MIDNLTVITNNQPIANKEKRVTTRKIGKCTYIVSSSFKEGKRIDELDTLIERLYEESFC